MEPLKLAPRESFLPKGTSQLGPPVCKRRAFEERPIRMKIGDNKFQCLEVQTS